MNTNDKTSPSAASSAKTPAGAQTQSADKAGGTNTPQTQKTTPSAAKATPAKKPAARTTAAKSTAKASASSKKTAKPTQPADLYQLGKRVWPD